MQDYVSSKAKMEGEFSGFKAGLCTNIAAQWKNCAQAPLCAEYPGKTPCNCGENMKIIGNYVIFGEITGILAAKFRKSSGQIHRLSPNSCGEVLKLWITLWKKILNCG